MNVKVTEFITRVVVVAPQERIDAMSAPDLRRLLRDLFDDEVRNLVIDLSAVPFMDSAGMAVLVNALKQARQMGGEVKLVWPKEEGARRILNLTRFDRVFSMTESASDAMKGF